MKYELKVPEAIRGRVNRTYVNFIQDSLEELEPVKDLPVDEYRGNLSKGAQSGLGMMKMSNGDLYRGNFKNGVRHGSGLCMFKSGALYRGEFNDDKPHGMVILYSGKNEILECRFDEGLIPLNSRVRIML